MSDIQKAQHANHHHPRPHPRKHKQDDLYTAKGPQNDGGYGARENKDPLFRDDDGSGDFHTKGPQNDGGYGVRKDKASDGVVRKDEKAQAEDPLFTDKVDIKFTPSK